MLSDPGFRELASLPLSSVVLQGLSRAGYNCVAEAAGLSVERLCSICAIGSEAAYAALRLIQRYLRLTDEKYGKGEFCLSNIHSAYDLLSEVSSGPTGAYPEPQAIVTMCRSFDDVLGGGFPIGRLTELCGEPGVGKTQFCIQACLTVQLPHWFGGLEGQAVFIDTEGNFIPKRVQQMAEAVERHCKNHLRFEDGTEPNESLYELHCPTVKKLMSGIHYIRVTDHTDLLATCQRLQLFCTQNPRIRLVVVDSVALPFRYDFDDIPQRNRLLACLAQSLLCVAGEQNAAVILTNQITTRINQTARWSSAFKEEPEQNAHLNLNEHLDVDRLVPALGDSWGHICSVRVFLTRFSDVCRRVRLLKHPGRPCGVGSYQITSGGIRDLVS
ncbi:unnamed protein product [Calicophoron daubneyi]|uniref:DNA repair protein RAD51 homolog 3 n=1 Tax=Calicophoron daubneyi TaxID=300641 RepID=A0AAV2TSU8_CALDB